MIRSIFYSLPRFSSLPSLLQTAWIAFAIGLFFSGGLAWAFLIADYGLEGASVESLTGKVVFSDAASMMVEDPDSGELTRLRMVRGVSYRLAGDEAFQGKTLGFTHLRGTVLTCTLDGKARCKALCSTAAECRENLRERDSSLYLGLFWFALSLACVASHYLGQHRREPPSTIF